MAGAIAEIAYETMIKNFRRIDTTKTKIYLIEGHTHILPTYPPNLSQKARGYLERFGVQVITGRRVTNVSKDGVTVDELFIPSHNVLWAAGNQASPLLKELAIPLDRQGRALVGHDLSIPDHPEIFVIGDAACAMDKHRKPLPGLASVAIQQGRYVAQVIRRKWAHKDRPPFRYLDKGTMATIGKTKAIGTFGKFQFSGFPAWMAWCFIHVLYLIGFRNRMVVLVHWLFSYFTGQRGARLIYRSIDEQP
jgi:NADH dehydrogenase